MKRILILLFCSALGLAHECGYPGAPLFGNFEPQRSSFLYQEGEIITYSCESGYGLMYNPWKSYTRTCQCNGQWSGNIPTCLKDLSYGFVLETLLMETEGLPKRKSPENPKCTLDKNIPKSRDFKLSNLQSNTSVCLNSTCKMPPITHLRFFLDNPGDFKGQTSDPVSVYVLQSANSSEEPCEIIPRDGGFLVECRSIVENPDAIFRITLNDGVWMDFCDWEAFNTKEIPCGYPEVPAHSVISTIKGTSYTFQCEDGYELHGDPEQKCDPTNPYTPFPYSLSTSCVDKNRITSTDDNLKFEPLFVIIALTVFLVVETLGITCLICLHRRRHHHSRPKLSDCRNVNRTNGSNVLTSFSSKNSPSNLNALDPHGYEIPVEVVQTFEGNGALKMHGKPSETPYTHNYADPDYGTLLLI